MSEQSQWLSAFSEREQKEIKFARLYAKDFAHGTTGHNQLIVIAKMAEALDVRGITSNTIGPEMLEVKDIGLSYNMGPLGYPGMTTYAEGDVREVGDSHWTHIGPYLIKWPARGIDEKPEVVLKRWFLDQQRAVA